MRRLSLPAALLIAAPAAAQNLLLNEVDADTPGTDNLEFIEIYDGGAGGTSLDGHVVVLYNGSSDSAYNAFDLGGFSTDANGYFVLGNSGVVPTPGLIFSGNTLQNGADGVALYMDDASNFPNGTAITLVNLVDAVVYDTNDPDDAGLAGLLNAGQPQLNEGAFGNSSADSNQRCASGVGGGRNTSYWVQGTPTPGGEPGSLGTSYCSQNANSTGEVARIRAYGSSLVADNDVTLVACSLPQNEFGYFLVSSGMGFVDLPGAGLSNGNLCLMTGGTLGRYGHAAQTQNAGLEGVISLSIDLSMIPQAAGQPPIAVTMPGDTWYFQAWYRDNPGGGPANNFTDGVSVTFN
ncbi:MAG: lamin tail domain-containing protein [bacterium]|nr:lamin tail domain-containing protein [bacterium]